MLVYDLKYWFMGNMFSNLFKFLATIDGNFNTS